MDEQAARVEPKRLMVKRSPSGDSCSLTEDETSSSTVTDRDDDVQLITRPKRAVSASPSLLNFASEIQEAAGNPEQVSLSLTNFIERSTRHDVCALRDLLLRGDRKWESVSFEDVCYATSFRRWAYKKENIHHHIQKLCVSNAIPLDFHAHMEINLDDMSSAAALSLLAEVKKHPEVRGLTMVGHLNHEQEVSLLKTVTSLVRLQDRDWDALNVYTGFSGGDEADYEHWRQTILHYMEIFSGLYTKYNAPLDIRPCASS